MIYLLDSYFFAVFINWTSPFPNLGLLGGIFHFYSNFKKHFCKQTVENLIRCLVLRRLTWFYTVCLCPTKRLGLNELKRNTSKYSLNKKVYFFEYLGMDFFDRDDKPRDTSILYLFHSFI